MNDDKLKEILNQIRLELFMSWNRFSKAVKVSRMTVSEFLRGERKISPLTRMRLKRFVSRYNLGKVKSEE